MPSTPWQAEILAPGICEGVVPHIPGCTQERLVRSAAVLADISSGRISRPGIDGHHRRHLVFATGSELSSSSAIFPVSTQNHTPLGEVAQIGHAGCFLGPGVPHHGLRGVELLDDDAATPPAMFECASRRRIQVYAVGLRADGDERRGLPFAPSRVLSM
jgi:hypothetical protein